MLVKSGIILGIIGLILVAGSFIFSPATQAETPKVAGQDQRTEGKRLFEAKGCAVCHSHKSVAGSGQIAVAPDLSNYKGTVDFTKQFLKDPKAIKPSTRMPTLGLNTAEIEALTIFLTTR
jgi:cytochrome c2